MTSNYSSHGWQAIREYPQPIVSSPTSRGGYENAASTLTLIGHLRRDQATSWWPSNWRHTSLYSDERPRSCTPLDLRQCPFRADGHGRNPHLSGAAIGSHLRCVGAASGRGSESNSRDSSASGLVRSDGSNVAGRRRYQREWWPIHTTRW